MLFRNHEAIIQGFSDEGVASGGAFLRIKERFAAMLRTKMSATLSV